MRSILVHVCNDPGLEARFQAALDIARGFDAHITFLQAISHNVALPGDFYGNLAAAMMPVVQEQADELRAAMEDRLGKEDVRWDWVQEVGMADSRLLSHAALNDCVLVGAMAPLGSETQPSRLAGALAIQGRTPVMVIPREAKGFEAAKPVVVGWNGSPESSHALKAALPLMATAGAVHLITATGEKDARMHDLPPDEGAEYLSRHGIACELVELPALGRHPAELLIEAALHREAGCLVMGAYGHARMFELVFGGVTRTMLKDPPLPLLLAH